MIYDEIDEIIKKQLIFDFFDIEYHFCNFVTME